MKKKLIALLCAMSMLATSVVAIAEDAELSQEPAEEVIEQVVEEEQETFVEETEEPAAQEDEEVAEETVEEQEEATQEEVVEEEISNEEVILEEDEEIVEEEQEEIVSSDAPVMMMMSAPAPVDLIADAQEARDELYEILKTYKGLDGGILDPELYAAYEAAYKAGKTAFWDAEKTAEELAAISAEIIATFNAVKDVVTAREKILSGNVITAADKAFYPNIGADTLPSLTYTWTGVGAAGPNPEASGQDANDGYTRLLSGVGNTPYDNIPNICWGKWDWRGTTNLDFNLGEEAYVTGADFWENAGGSAGTNYCSDKIEVYTSDNGTEWTLQKEVTVDQSDCPNSLKDTRVDFDTPVKCRYVRVAVIDNAGYQLKFNEIVLRGFRTTQSSTTPFSIEDIDYKRLSPSKRIISLDGIDKVRVTGKVKNNTDEAKEVVVIGAAYKDGDLLDLRFSKESVSAYGSEEFTCTMQNLDVGPGVELYTYVWDGFGSAKALAPIEKFGGGKHEMADFGADGEGAKFDIGGERLTAWGLASGNGALNDVTLIVLKAGITAEDVAQMTAPRDVREAVVYLEQTTPVGREYRFESFPENVEAIYGNNNAYVTKSNGDQLFYRLLYLDTNGENELIRAFKGSTAETMRATIDSNEYLIRGVKAVDEIIEKYDRDTVLDSVAGMILDTEYETAEELLAEILAAVALTDLNNIGTRDEAIETIDKYCEELGIADNGIYTKLYSGDKYKEFKKEISEKFVGQGYASIKDFIAEFCEEIVVDMLNDATNYTDVEKVILADADYVAGIGFDIEEYEDLAPAKQIRVQKKMMNHNDFANMEAVIDAFNAAVANPGTDKKYGSSGGGGGGFSSTPSLGTSIPLSGVTADDVSVFKDLSEAEWARESILALYNKGIVSGMTDTTFAPSEDVTREQFTKMLVAAFELLDSSAECDFDDVDNSAWYYEAIASAVKNGIVFGLSEESFGIGAKITREDMAVLAYRALVAKGNKVIYDKSQISDFTDDGEISEYAREAVYAMRGNGIMQGRGNNEFQPKAQATRAEAAKIIYSIMGK